MRGQLSLEYLLLLCAFFSAFLLVLPAASEAFNASLFAMDVSNAKAFLHDFRECIEKLSVLGDGSIVSIEARPLNEWKLAVSGAKAELDVLGEDGNRKLLSLAFSAHIAQFSETISSPKTLLLAKKHGQILIVSDYPKPE